MNLLTLKSMTLEHFRCFDSLAVDFDPQLTIFVGVNGSGKTTVIEAVSILLQQISSILHSNSSPEIGINTLKNGYNSLLLAYKISLPSIENYSISIGCKLENNQFIQNNIFRDLLPVNDALKNTQKLIAICYSSKRIINSYKRQTGSCTEQRYAFKNAFSPEIDFSTTLTWFIEKASQEALEAVGMHDLTHRIPELSAVRTAVAKALGDYNEPFVGETPPRLFITHKDAPDTPLTLEQLSDGYRTMLALVMDLARRMAVANAHVHWKAGETVLHSPGIVLIDEVELHLHPSWQQKVLPTLMEIFPNVQFIVTTHSPQVLTSIEPKHIRLLRNSAVEPITSSTYGAEASRVLEEVLGVAQRPENAEPKAILDKYFKLVEAGDYAGEEAKHYRAQLDAWLYGDPLLDLADMHIQRAERKKARDRNHA